MSKRRIDANEGRNGIASSRGSRWCHRLFDSGKGEGGEEETLSSVHLANYLVAS